MSAHAAEVASGERFRFGENWRRFLEQLDEGRILAAENSLRDMLESGRLDPLSFLDIGSGSGLFSLAARRLGAVTSWGTFLDPLADKVLIGGVLGCFWWQGVVAG